MDANHFKLLNCKDVFYDQENLKSAVQKKEPVMV